MTVERTRQIFGKKMEEWTDEQVTRFISEMGIICDALLKTAISELTSYKKFDKTNSNKV